MAVAPVFTKLTKIYISLFTSQTIDIVLQKQKVQRQLQLSH